MKPAQAEEIARDAYVDRRDKLGYDEMRHIEAVVEGVDQYLTQAGYDGHDMTALCVSEDAKVVAWLHDMVEDHLVSFRELYHDLTGVQFEALLMITRDGRQTYSNYIRMIRDYRGQVGDIIRAVKNADLDHNISRPCPEDMRGMREPGGRYYRAKEVLSQKGAQANVNR